MYSIQHYPLEEIDEEEQMVWHTEHDGDIDDDDDDDDDAVDDELMIEDSSSMSSSPSIPDENINFDLVYALHTFVATVEGQASVVKGDALILMEDTNIYWWLVEVLKTREVGYIPAENIETPYERLARLNKHRNVEITSPSIQDASYVNHQAFKASKRVTIAEESSLQVFHYEVETDIDDDENDEHDQSDQETCIDNEEMQNSNGTDHAERIKVQQEWQEKRWDIQEPIHTSHSTSCETPKEENQSKQLMNEKEEHTTDDSLNHSINSNHYNSNNNNLSLVPTDSNIGSDLSMSPSASNTITTAATTNAVTELRVFAGNIGQGPLFHSISIDENATAEELVKTAVDRFGIKDVDISQDTTIEYYIAVQGLDGEDYVLSPQDKPLSIFKTLTDSLTTPMPSLTHIKRISQQSLSSTLSVNSSSRRPRSSSFSNYEQTSFDEDSVIRLYLHRRIKRAHGREGLLYIKVSLYPDETAIACNNSPPSTKAPHNAFTNNPTPSRLKKQRNKDQQMPSRSEIDRIDKIIPIQLDSFVGAVINTALEKFHVPDAEAENFPSIKVNQARQITRYKMLMRGNNQEIELDPNESMSSVLSQQISDNQNVTEPITSDLLFILLRAGDDVSQKRRTVTPQGGEAGGGEGGTGVGLNNSSHSKFPAELTIPTLLTVEDRRPSILDILMDSPRVTERRPMVTNLLVDASTPRSPDYDKKILNSSERKASASSTTSSLNQGVASQGGTPITLNSVTNINNSGSNYGSHQQQQQYHLQQQQQSPSSSSSSSFFPTTATATAPNFNNNSNNNNRSPNTFSPPSILGFRRSSVQSSSISGSSSTEDRPITTESNILDGTSYYHHPSNSSSSSCNMARSHSVQPTSSSTTSPQSPASNEKRKESFKQQFKRFVGWGSKTKKQIPAPLNTSTTNNVNSSSNPNYMMQPNSAAITITDSPSDIHHHHFVSAPSTPIPQTPGTPRSFKSRQLSLPQQHTSHEQQVDYKIDQSQNPKNKDDQVKQLQDPSAAAIAAAAAVSAATKRLSTVSSISSSSISTEELSENAQKVDLEDDSEEEEEEEIENLGQSEKQEIESLQDKKKKNEHLTPITTTPSQLKEDVSEIQTQYAMWMNSQTPTEASAVDSNAPSVLSNNSAPPPPTTPTKNPLRNSSKSVISSASEQVVLEQNSNVMMTSLSNTSTNSTSTTTSSSLSAITTQSSHHHQSNKEEVKQQQPDLDDLFLLVAHGVDFLTSKENSKWEEEGGYEFHPWNRPQSSFAVRQAAAQNKNSLPIEFTEKQTEDEQEADEVQQQQQQQQQQQEEIGDNTSAAITMARSILSDEGKPMLSPPLTPQTSNEQQGEGDESSHYQESLAKRVLGAKNEKPTAQPIVESQALDDDELQRIVASHIVFY